MIRSRSKNGNVSTYSSWIFRSIYCIAFVLGILFWTGIQFVTPVIESYFLDVFFVPILASIILGSIFRLSFPQFRTVAWPFIAGTAFYSVLFSIFLGFN